MAARLTDISIQNAKPGPTRREIPDGGCKGLYLIVQPSGRKSWAVRYRHNGKTRKLTLDGFPSLATARKLATEAMENPDRDPAADKAARKAAAKDAAQSNRDSIPEVIELYLKHYAEGRATRRKSKPKPHTLAATSRNLRRLAAPEVWGSKRIQDIRKRDIIELLDGMVDAGNPIAANRTFAALQPLFAWAVQRDLIEASPAIWNKVAEEARARRLSSDEVKVFWEATDALGYPFQPIFRLLLLTGQRRNEVAEMTWQEIDLDRCIWTLPASRTKNSREHSVPLSEPVLAILKGLPHVESKQGYVFTTTGKSAPSGFSKVTDALRAKMMELAGAPVPHWSLHDLRRTMATMMNDDLAIEPHVVEAILNHVSGSRAGVAGVYNRAAYLKQKQSALEAWGRYVESLVSGKAADNVVAMARA